MIIVFHICVKKNYIMTKLLARLLFVHVNLILKKSRLPDECFLSVL